jgi:hypothetical protein
MSKSLRESYERPTIAVQFGYIVDVLTSDDEAFYVAVVMREISSPQMPADSNPIMCPLGHPIEELTSLYGEPEALIGRRVMIEYVGSNWGGGVARLTLPRVPTSIGTAMELPSRGFRHAVAGSGSK